jgi:hypothetical protein
LLDLQKDPSPLSIADMVSNVEYEVDVRDIDYQRQTDKAWLARIYQPKGINHQARLPTQSDVRAAAFSRNTATGIIQTNLTVRGL